MSVQLSGSKIFPHLFPTPGVYLGVVETSASNNRNSNQTNKTMKRYSLPLVIALSLSTGLLLNAQDGEPPAPPKGEKPGRPMRIVPPLMAALDTNKDGTIDAAEIAAASESLKKLDKNGDGSITGDELHVRPGGPGGPPPGDPPRRGDGDKKGERPGRPRPR